MMINKFLSAALLVASFTTFAQVGIGTTTPEGALDIVSTNNGVIFPRVANTASVTTPVNGMVLYDVSEKCFRGYSNGAWTACGLVEGTIIKEVVALDGRIWMDRNLGASQVATSFNDEASYGDLYQWGRGKDGHQSRTSDTISTQATSGRPGHGDFITGFNNWLETKVDTLWEGDGTSTTPAKTSLDPCPTGFRVPTKHEWDDVLDNLTTHDTSGGFGSFLKLPAAINPENVRGLVARRPPPIITGNYWSSTPYSDGTADLADSFFVNLTNTITPSVLTWGNRARGYSVRCIKEL